MHENSRLIFNVVYIIIVSVCEQGKIVVSYAYK
jgi:NhaP-type Na+/H+ and K+/H+ antiporter